MNATQMAAHIRNRIKAAGIKANVRVAPGRGAVVQVNAPAYGVDFTEDQQREIRHIAVCNRLTWACGQPIDVDQMTNPHSFNFYLNHEKV